MTEPIPCDGPSEWLACSVAGVVVLRRTIRDVLAYGGTFGGGVPGLERNKPWK